MHFGATPVADTTGVKGAAQVKEEGEEKGGQAQLSMLVRAAEKEEVAVAVVKRVEERALVCA